MFLFFRLTMLGTLMSLESTFQDESIYLKPQAFYLIWGVEKFHRPRKLLSNKICKKQFDSSSYLFSLSYKTHFFSSPTLLSLWKPSNKLVIPIIVTRRQTRERDTVSWIEIRVPLTKPNEFLKAILILSKDK